MSANTGGTFTFFIETGLHAGTVQRLAPGIYTLGSELDADIVLSDKDVKPIHVIVELGQQGLRLEPLQGPLAVKGETADLEPGGERHLPLPASFSIGDAHIKVSAPKDAVKTRRRTRAALVTAGLAAIAVLGFQVIGPFAGGDLDGVASLSMETPASVIGEPIEETTAPETMAALQAAETDTLGAEEDAVVEPPGVTIDEAAAALRERLAAEDFADIDVKTGVDRVMAQGGADPSRMDDWQNIRFWFDSTFGQDVLLVASVELAEPEEPPQLAIEAVWSGEKPYLIAGGRRFFVGNQVGDGWAIDHIGSSEIIFRRGDNTFSLTL